MKDKYKFLIGIVLVFILVMGSLTIYIDKKKSECRDENSFAIRLEIKKLCEVTTDGSFTYNTNSWFFENKECEVIFTCNTEVGR